MFSLHYVPTTCVIVSFAFSILSLSAACDLDWALRRNSITISLVASSHATTPLYHQSFPQSAPSRTCTGTERPARRSSFPTSLPAAPSFPPAAAARAATSSLRSTAPPPLHRNSSRYCACTLAPSAATSNTRGKNTSSGPRRAADVLSASWTAGMAELHEKGRAIPTIRRRRRSARSRRDRRTARAARSGSPRKAWMGGNCRAVLPQSVEREHGEARPRHGQHEIGAVEERLDGHGAGHRGRQSLLALHHGAPQLPRRLRGLRHFGTQLPHGLLWMSKRGDPPRVAKARKRASRALPTAVARRWDQSVE